MEESVFPTSVFANLTIGAYYNCSSGVREIGIILIEEGQSLGWGLPVLVHCDFAYSSSCPNVGRTVIVRISWMTSAQIMKLERDPDNSFPHQASRYMV